jgi:quercetin dioxygenase-like cupin family protein
MHSRYARAFGVLCEGGAAAVVSSTMNWMPRRIVTGHDAAGTSVVLSADPPPVETRLPHDGVAFFELWSTTEMPARITAAQQDPIDGPVHIPPPRGGTRIRVNEFQPGHVRDGRQSPWHRTETVDYGIMIEGELVLLVEEGEVVLRPGDVVVQRGTNHAWANRSDSVARIAFVLIDGVFDDALAGTLGEETLADAASAREHVVTAQHNLPT